MNELNLDLDTFLIRLNQTIRWCSRPGRGTDPETCLRTKELEPWFWLDERQTTTTDAALLAEKYSSEGQYYVVWEYWMWGEKRTEMVERVVTGRANLLNTPTPSMATSLSGGRLVAYWPDSSVAMGNSEFVTNGFFTANDAPPWDTWIAFFHEEGGYLLSWIPPEFVGSVTEAVDHSGDGALTWLEDMVLDPIHQALKQKGLI